MSELVSILIPAHNEERWIGATLRSAIGQSWPRVEIIVVDDGSTDGTVDAARSIGAPNVKVVTQANRGASAARNHAMSLAQGEYIQWLDADDLLAPDKIALQMRVARDLGDPNTLLTSAFAEFFVRTEKGSFRPTSLWTDLAPIDFLLHKFNDNAWLNTATWLVSRDLTMRAGPWNESLSLDDDGEYFARLVSLASAVRFVRDAKVYYRRGDPGSLSRGVSARACDSLMTSLELCIGHLRLLEDSPRTRAASVQLLQTWVNGSDCFCPDVPERFERARALARQLGGDLRPHRMSWKYAPIKAVFGWSAARRARNTWSNLKLTAKVRLDQLSAGHGHESPR